MATIAKPPIPFRMYRHFAVITLALTATVAMLAEGEKREALEQLAAADAVGGSTPWSKRDAGEQASLERREPYQPDVAGDFDYYEPAYGKPTVAIKQTDPATSVFGNIDRPSGRRSLPGYPQDYIDGLPEEEYRRLIAGLEKAGIADARERARRSAALDRASARRSGAATRPE